MRADNTEWEMGDFASDSEAWDWINTNTGQANDNAAAKEPSAAAKFMAEWFVPPNVIPAAFVALIVALALYRYFVGA